MRAEDFLLGQGSSPDSEVVKLNIGGRSVTVHPMIADMLERANAEKLDATGNPILINSSYRTTEQQQQLYNELAPKGARVAKPGRSFHEKGLALDVANWQESEPYLRKYGLVNDLADDKNHFSYGETRRVEPRQVQDNTPSALAFLQSADVQPTSAEPTQGQGPNSVDFLAKPEPEQPSIFSIPEAQAAEPAQPVNMSASDFLTGITRPGQEAKQPGSAIDFLNAPQEPGFFSELGTGASKAAGIVMGALNAPHAFVAGAHKPMAEDPEWQNKPWYEQQYQNVKSGLESAYESAFVPGKWGSSVNEISKAYSGKTIEENLPESLKPYSTSIEFLGSIITDPVVTVGAAKDIIRHIGKKEIFGEIAKRLPESEFSKLYKLEPGKLPEGVAADLEKLNQLDEAEKATLRQQLIDLLKAREDYARRVTDWGERELYKAETREAIEAQPKLLPPGQGFELRGIPEEVYSRFSPELAGRLQELGLGPRRALPAGQGFEMVEKTPEVVRVEHGAYPRGQSFVAGVEQDVPTFIKRGESLQEAPNIGHYEQGMLQEAKQQLAAGDNPFLKRTEGYGPGIEYERVGSSNPDWFVNQGYTKQQANQIIDSALSGDILTEKQSEFVKGILDYKEKEWQGLWDYKPAHTQTRSEYAQEGFSQFERGLKRGMQPQQAYDQYIAPLERESHAVKVEKALSEGKDVPDAVMREYPEVTAKYKPDYVLKSLFPDADPKVFKASGGFVSGIQQDDQGNITYDPTKALAGGLLVAGGIKAAGGQKRFTQTLAKNPAWLKVQDMIGTEKTAPFSLAGIFSKFNTSILDRFSPLKDVSPQTYEEARKYASYKDVAAQKFDQLREALTPVRSNEALFTDYVTANRAMDRANRGLKNPNGVTLQDARQAIREIETHYAASGKDPKELKAALQGFHNWTQENILRPALDSGIISKQSYNSIVSKNSFYATFDILEKLPQDLDKLPALPGKELFSVSSQGVVKAITGTEKEIRNPIEATIAKFVDAQATFARNKVASTFIDDPAIKGLIQPIATSPKEFAMMQARGLKPVMEGSFDKRAFDTVNRFKDGQVERYVAPKEIVDSLKQLTPAQAPKAIQALNTVFREAATTLYLPFTISNAMRDGLMAFTTSKAYSAKDMFGRFQADWLKGLAQGGKQEFGKGSKAVQEYLEAGGGFGYAGNLRNAQVAKSQLFDKTLPQQAMTVLKSPITLIQKASAAVELAPRMAVYQRAIAQGKTPAQAAMMAREATIDFSRGGSLTKVANQFVPFLNARVQGLSMVGEALKKDPKTFLSKVFMSAVLPGMGAYAYNRLYHSDLYDDIPGYVKDNYFTIITGTEKDPKGRTVPQYLAIAKGDVGQIAFNPIEYFMDQMLGKDPVSAKKFLINWLSDISPVPFAREGELSLSKAAGGLLPPIVKGAAEDWANLNLYTGKEIVPYYMGKSKPPELQYKDNTPETYKWLGKELGISPLRLQNFAQNVLAGYGREGLDPSAMLRGLTGRLVKTQGGEKEDRAWTVIKDIENGYEYTRAYAQEMAKAGNRDGAMKLMREWNKGLNSRISEIQKFGIRDKGGLRNDYMFTPEKMLHAVTQRQDKRTPLEKKISIR